MFSINADKQAAIAKWKKGATCFHKLAFLAVVKNVGQKTIEEMIQKEGVRLPNGLSVSDCPFLHSRAATMYCLGKMLENIYRINATLGTKEVAKLLRPFGTTEERVLDFMGTNMKRALKAMKVILPKRIHEKIEPVAIKTITPPILKRAIFQDGSGAAAESDKAQTAKQQGLIKRYEDLYVMTKVVVAEKDLQTALNLIESEGYEDIRMDYADGKAILTCTFPVAKLRGVDGMPEHITEPSKQLKWIVEFTNAFKQRLQKGLKNLGSLQSFAIQYR